MLKFKLGCYNSYPLKGISSRDSDRLASKEIRICLPQLIFSLPCSLSFTVMLPLDPAHLDALVLGNSLR